MKRILLVFVLFFAVQLLNAQEPSTSKETAIRKLISIAGGEKMASTMIDQMIEIYRQESIPIDAKLMEELKKEADVASLMESMVPMYDKYYTEKEINQLVAFYNSPLGKKTIEVMPKLTQESMQIGAEWGKKAMERVRKKLKPEAAGSSSNN
jgi:uncharacterized protein